MKKQKIKCNKVIKHGNKTHLPGHELEVEIDDNGIFVDNFWRRRLQDSQIDNCIELVRCFKKKTKKEIDNFKEGESIDA